MIIFLLPETSFAANGTPSTSSFGYGIRVDLLSPDSHLAISEAGKFNFDWIAIELNWQNIQSKADNPPSWQDLDSAMVLASENQLAVMVSITQAPPWAMGQDGPDADKTSIFVEQLTRRYPDILLAIEMFPSANTVKGWGTTPNPGAYTRLLKVTSEALENISTEVLIIGVGLTPLGSPSEGIDDLNFLRKLYKEGITEFMPVLGIRLPPSGSDPLARLHHPELFPLRRYENIRSIMSENGHKHGLIWITGFSWDSETMDSSYRQSVWMKQAYLLFRSQLYIGAAFFDGLNPSQAEASKLLLQGGGYHPGFGELIQIIAQDNNEKTILISIELNKRITKKNYPKGLTL